MRISRKIEIPDNELQWSFVRSSGPGGQNVNKVATAVQLRFDAAHSPSLPEDVRERLLKLAGQRATEEGVIFIEAKSLRSQSRNREQALAKLRDLVRQAERKPRRRLPTSPSAGAREKTLRRKQRQSEKKKRRRWVPDQD